jgi:hypothetical protein
MERGALFVLATEGACNCDDLDTFNLSDTSSCVRIMTGVMRLLSRLCHSCQAPRRLNPLG